jgi:DNA polymerase I-like protein with 3'-5' exonuclease and polymerase domains
VQDCLGIDTETNGTALWHGCLPFFVSFCDNDGYQSWFEWKVNPFTRQPIIPKSDVVAIRKIIAGYRSLCFHHSKFDIRVLALIGIDLTDRWEDIHDTLLQSHVLNSGEDHSLKPLGVKYLEFLDDDEDELAAEVKRIRRKPNGPAIQKGWTLGDEWQWDYWMPKALDPSSTLLRTYGLNDPKRTMLLHLAFLPEIKRVDLEAMYERERQLLPVVYRMEERGIGVRPATIKKTIRTFTKLATDAEYAVMDSQAARSIARTSGEAFNVRSSKQLQTLLYDKLGFRADRLTKNGADSTDAQSLIDIWTSQLGNHADAEGGSREFDKNKSIRARIIDNLLRCRKATSGVTYAEAYDRLKVPDICPTLELRQGYCLHPSLNQTGTRTPRFSSSNPNGQNVAKKSDMPLRDCFGPRPNTFWWDLDYANLELRIFAVLADEKPLLDAFAKGESVMKTIALRLWGDGYTEWQYKRTKNFIYALLYGAGRAKADITLGMDGGYDKLRSEFPGITKATNRAIAEVKKKGYATTMFGYHVYPKENKEYAALNSVIQGTAGDILKYAMLNCDREVPEAKLLLCVHDELIFEADNELRPPKKKGSYQLTPILGRLIDLMIEPGKRIGVPLAVGADVVVKHWGERFEVAV